MIIQNEIFGLAGSKQRFMNRFFLSIRAFILVGVFGLLGACTTAELAIDLAKKRVNKKEAVEAEQNTVIANPHYKVGNPYQIEGIWYYPERDLTYDKTGIASWYGDEFGGRLSANGEIFDPALVSAAHKTLPMPSVVRVTNLDNGKSLVVRINDRGPYVSGRIIDMSREAARLLGFKDNGIARVRVKLLVEQTLRLEELARNGEFPLLSDDSAPLPETVAAGKPAVSLSARTTRANPQKKESGESALDLLSHSRSGNVIDTQPLVTDIWIQVGAFHSEDNARNLLASFADLGNGKVFEAFKDGRALYRARLGPIDNVEQADSLLKQIYSRGFEGADIVVE